MADETPPTVAQRDWHTRARVRIREDVSAHSFDPFSPRHFRAGEELVMLQWGRAGNTVKRDLWWTSYDIDNAFLIPADAVEVLEVLDEVNPVYGGDEPDGWVGLPEWMKGELE